MFAKHLPKIDDDGWKFLDVEFRSYVEENVGEGKFTRQQVGVLLDTNICPQGNNNTIKPPITIKVDVSFWDCVESLRWLLSYDKPSKITVRSTSSVLLIYGYVEASEGVFGESLLIRDKIHYQICTWGRKEENNSSNWREFEKLVIGMEESGKKQRRRVG